MNIHNTKYSYLRPVQATIFPPTPAHTQCSSYITHPYLPVILKKNKNFIPLYMANISKKNLDLPMIYKIFFEARSYSVPVKFFKGSLVQQ